MAGMAEIRGSEWAGNGHFPGIEQGMAGMAYSMGRERRGMAKKWPRNASYRGCQNGLS